MNDQIFPELVSASYLDEQKIARGRVTYGERRAKHWELELILSGTGRIITNDDVIPTVPGRIFIRKPGMKLEGFPPYGSYYILYEDKQNSLDGLPYYLDHQENLETYFQIILRNARCSDTAGQLAVQSGLCGLLSQLLRIRSSTLPKKIGEAVDYIRDHLAENLSVADLASASGYSLNHFTRLFRMYTGRNPMDYILDCRIRQACILLEESDQTVEDAAIKSGFRNLSYFFRTFRRIKQMTPDAYRKSRQIYFSSSL